MAPSIGQTADGKHVLVPTDAAAAENGAVGVAQEIVMKIES